MDRSSDFDLETWIVQVGGDIVEKKALLGSEALTQLERLVYCLWVADYGMRNAGDLATASDLYPRFQEEGASLARELGLAQTHAAFAEPAVDLERSYFDLLGGIVDELKKRGGK